MHSGTSLRGDMTSSSPACVRRNLRRAVRLKISCRVRAHLAAAFRSNRREANGTNLPKHAEVEAASFSAGYVLFLQNFFKASDLPVAFAFRAGECEHGKPTASRRRRNIFPVPHIAEWPQQVPTQGNALVPELWHAVCTPGIVFPTNSEVQVDEAFLSSKGHDRREYLKLTCRELLCGKLRLRLQVRGVARVFAAAKRSKGRQRKIWDGSAISSQAARPPKPERLANPSSFLDILVRPDEKLYLSKRDAATYFDTLAVPPELQPWFGQEPVKVQELIGPGKFSHKQLLALVDDVASAEDLLPDTLLYPVHTVWPMGFSWSSCVAQSNTLGVLLEAGVKPSAILSLDHALPTSQMELCAVATADTLLFHKCPKRGQKTLTRLDQAFGRNGIARNCDKDISLASSMTALGCDISTTPPLVEPCKQKLAKLVAVLCDLLETPTGSPHAVNSVLGIEQWFCLLQRGMFSIFDSVYEFVRRDAQKQPRSLPKQVQNELLVGLVLMPLLPAALDRPFLSELLACDAAPEFGFGVCSLPCGPKVVEDVGRLAERRGDYVRLLTEPDDQP